MKNSEEAIERVLAGLRDAQSPDGMERRVLAAMEARTAQTARFAWRSWSLGLAATVLVVATVMASAAHRRSQQPAVAVVTAATVIPAPAVRAPVAPVQRRNTGVLRVAQSDVKFAGDGRGQSIAEEPVASGGIPAPPMPLTDEERLLLHLARRSDPQELTPLIAEVRAKQDAEFDAEFQEFFAPPEPVVDEKTDPTNEDKGDSR